MNCHLINNYLKNQAVFCKWYFSKYLKILRYDQVTLKAKVYASLQQLSNYKLVQCLDEKTNKQQQVI